MIRNAHAENYEFVSFPEMRTSAITMLVPPVELAVPQEHRVGDDGMPGAADEGHGGEHLGEGQLGQHQLQHLLRQPRTRHR